MSNIDLEDLAEELRNAIVTFEDDDRFSDGAGLDYATRTSEFFDSLLTWYEDKGFLTEKQVEAAQNALIGMERWLDRRDE